MGVKAFDEAWNNEGLQMFATRHLNMKRNQVAQTVKLKMFAPITERHVNGAELLNSGIGMKPYKSTHDEVSDWVVDAKRLIPK